MSEEHGWQLTVLRPGSIWGEDHAELACMGQGLGRVHLVFGALTRLPLTHVENCADCFAHAVENPRAVGETFNVVDSDDVRAWRYAREYLRRAGTRRILLPVPFCVAMTVVRLAHLCSKRMFRGKGKLPSILVPCRFEARFKPLRFPNQKVRDVLGWTPRLSFEECLDRSWVSREECALPAAVGARPDCASA
jgi:nucleoside-diphosphate-sugar epimerase